MFSDFRAGLQCRFLSENPYEVLVLSSLTLPIDTLDELWVADYEASLIRDNSVGDVLESLE